MPNFNTYKGSQRDGFKYLTVNGFELEGVVYPEWGWYGLKTLTTAHAILKNEYGFETANMHFMTFARGWLAEQPEDGFTITSGALWVFLEKWESRPYVEHQNA